MFEYKYGTSLVNAVTDCTRSRILETLYGHPSGLTELGSVCGLDPENLGMYLDVLSRTGLVSRSVTDGVERLGISERMHDVVGNFLRNTGRISRAAYQ